MSAVGGISGMMPQVVSGASMRMPPAQKMTNLFQQVDTGNTGSITKSQFEQAFQTLKMPAAFRKMGADAVFSKLDNGTGSVSKQDFINGMMAMMTQNRQQHGTSVSAAHTLAGSLSALNTLGGQAPTASLGNNVNVYA